MTRAGDVVLRDAHCIARILRLLARVDPAGRPGWIEGRTRGTRRATRRTPRGLATLVRLSGYMGWAQRRGWSHLGGGPWGRALRVCRRHAAPGSRCTARGGNRQRTDNCTGYKGFHRAPPFCDARAAVRARHDREGKARET